MDDLPRFVDDLFGCYAILLLGVGSRAGLLDALLAGPGTADEIAARAGADPRSTREWLSALAAGGYARHDRGSFSASDDLVGTMSAEFPMDARVALEGVLSAADAYDDLARAWQTGSGLDSDALRPMMAFDGVNAPLYRQALVPDWIEGIPGIAERLTAGGRVAEVGAGVGDALSVVASAFPETSVIGYDLRPPDPVALPANASLRVGDARQMATDGPFDLIYVLDTLHHISDAESLVADLRSALAPGGALMVVENDAAGDLDEDLGDPFAIAGYTSSVFYCLQEALGGDGSAHACTEPPQWVADALEAAGFEDVSLRVSESGMVVVTGRVAS